jgi:ferredoxin
MTDFSGDRRSFFRHAFGDAARQVARLAEAQVVRDRYVRPPGALPEVGFLAACTRCDACRVVCPAGAILTVPRRGGLAAGTPFLEPARIPCIACDAMPCAAACPTGALTVPADGWVGERLGRVEFRPERCVTFEGKPCRVCIEACPVGDAALTADADGHPVLIADGCVGCGVCVRDCITLPSSFTFHAEGH